MAEYGGYILAHGGSISAMDKALDADPSKNHDFLLALDKLVKKKTENPGLRFSTKSSLKEELTMQEETTSGLRAPKKAFMVLEKYEKKYGKPDPSLIKTIRYRGKVLQGVDVQKDEDVARLSLVLSCLGQPTMRVAQNVHEGGSIAYDFGYYT